MVSVPSMMNSCVGRLSLLRSDTLTPKNRKPGIGRKILNSLDTSSIGPLWHIAHKPPGGAGSNGHVVEHRSPSLLRGGDAIRKPRRRTSVGEEEKRQRREEARRRLLELRDQLKLKRARLDAVPGVRVNGAERLAFERGLAPVVHEHRLQRRRIDGRWRTPEQRDARRRRIVGEPDARGERDVDADGRMLGDPRRSADAIVEAVTDEQRIGGVPGESPSRVPGRERAGLDAVARDAGPAVALEGLLVKEAATLFEPLRPGNRAWPRREAVRDRSRR